MRSNEKLGTSVIRGVPYIGIAGMIRGLFGISYLLTSEQKKFYSQAALVTEDQPKTRTESRPTTYQRLFEKVMEIYDTSPKNGKLESDERGRLGVDYGNLLEKGLSDIGNYLEPAQSRKSK